MPVLLLSMIVFSSLSHKHSQRVSTLWSMFSLAVVVISHQCILVCSCLPLRASRPIAICANTKFPEEEKTFCFEDFPLHLNWKADNETLQRRRNNTKQIGRMVTIHLSQVRHFYLRSIVVETCERFNFSQRHSNSSQCGMQNMQRGMCCESLHWRIDHLSENHLKWSILLDKFALLKCFLLDIW